MAPATPRLFRTIAAAAAVSALGLGATAPAYATESAPTPSTKKAAVAKISTKQFPQLVDRPGTSEDKIVLTAVKGVTWKVGADAVSAAVVDLGTAKNKMVPAEDDVVVIAEAVANDPTYTYTYTGPSQWDFHPSDATKDYDATDLESLLSIDDQPGTKDKATLKRAEGLEWSVDGVSIPDAKFGKKGVYTVALRESTVITVKELGASIVSGADTEWKNLVSTTSPIEYQVDNLKTKVDVGDNPFDATKGIGKGASVETVKITGVPGLKWQVGSSPKQINVKPGEVAYVAVPSEDLEDGTSITVRPITGKGYTLAADAKILSIDFEDDEAPLERDTDLDLDDSGVSATTVLDRPGSVNDTLVLPVHRGVIWHVAQADKKGKYVFKAQKPGKDGNVTYKVKHAKGATLPAPVKFRAYADRGYAASDQSVKTVEFKADDGRVAAPALTGGSYTLEKTPGIDSWIVTNEVADKETKTTYKATDLTAYGIASMTVPGKALALKLAKGYIAAP